MLTREESIRRLNLLDAVSIYCDGGLIGSNPSTVGGTWAWIALDVAGERQAMSSGIYLGHATNNMMEVLATLQALEAVPAGWSGTIYTDSEIAAGRLTRGWPLNGCPPTWEERRKQALRRVGEFHVVLVAGHPTGEDLQKGVSARNGRPVSRWNVFVDAECQRLAREYLQPLSWDDPESESTESMESMESTVNTANQDLNIPAEKCRSCGAPIYWLANETTQKMAPIDTNPTPWGSVVVLQEGTYRVLRAGERETYEGPRYTNHFQTCEHSKQWSRGGR